jgi:D-beta-D-heptose 7-phosphate kinase/D-beta-D-heptose 1-phosphate adenosyltransferase
MYILVIGDLILDINYFSKIERNAPEADIPIYNIIDTKYILGGASNVAQNLNNLKTNVELISVIGKDESGNIMQSLLNQSKINNKLFVDDDRKTTQKNRIFNNNKITVRHDIEDKHDINSILVENIINYVKQKEQIDAIVISDYNKGVITDELCRELINYANYHNIYTFVDPKIKNYKKYSKCFCFKPNLIEGQEISGKTNEEEIIEFIKKNIECKNIVLTCGKDGILVNDYKNRIVHNNKIEVIDVTGAGDIVLTVLVYIFLKNNDMLYAVKVANYIAGKSVQVIGNYQLCLDDLQPFLELKNNKIIYDYEIDKITTLSKNKNVVFTNGCFDILHSGHIKNLQFAKKQGDILVVGLNSDLSIKRLKGEKRPINSIEERSTMLSLFEFIDHIIIFEEETPVNILKLLKPDKLIKGSDYKKENIAGSEYVNEVILFNYIDNKSTSLLIDKIINSK